MVLSQNTFYQLPLSAPSFSILYDLPYSLCYGLMGRIHTAISLW